MRKHLLLSATAVGLILSGLAALPAAADTNISSSITTPTKTSDTGNLTVDITAQITLTTGTAITVNSDNTVTTNGAIYMGASTDNSTAILVDGAHTSNITINNNITVTDNYTQTDTLPTGALDGLVDYPFAEGTGRYGVHSIGAGPFNGNVTFKSPYIIQIEGNNSYAFRFENQLNGNFSSTGQINLFGDNSTAISLENGVTGNIYVSGTVNYFGKDSRGIYLNGDIGGALEIDAGITGSGYASINPASILTAAQIAALPANDVLQGGALVTVSGSVAKGILINAIPTTDSTNTSTDQDGDGNADNTQRTGSLSQYASAPALLIASSTAPITIGGVVYNSTAVKPPAINYGLLVRGNIASNALYPGFGATGIQLGGLGQNVTVANGIGVVGQISSQASNGDAFALLLKSGALTPRLDILSIGISASVNTFNLDRGAYAVDINAGASLPSININAGGGIAASGTGSTSNAIAIRDQSNTLRVINTSGAITSAITASDDNDDGFLDILKHSAVAIDTHTNTVGLDLNMVDSAPTDAAIAAPLIQGDILLGSGDDHLNFNGGGMVGNIDFGAGANSFILSGGALYSGKLTGTGVLELDLVKGETDLLASGATLNLSNLHVGAESTLSITADTAHPTTPVFHVGGNAVFDNGAKLDIQLNSMLLTPQTFTLITATNLNLGNINTSLDGNVPYIYHATLNQTGGNLTADFRLKTQAEGGYTDNQFAALVPVLTAAGQDPDGFSAIVTQFTKGGFDSVFNQYLPDYSGENLLTLSQGTEALNQSLASLTMIPDNDGGQYWLQEYGFQTTRKKGDTAGFRATTFSFAAGRETRLNPYHMAGVYVSLTSGNPLDSYVVGQESLTDSDLTIGGYWRMNTGAFKAWAHAGLGFVQVESTRQVLNTNISRTAKVRWDGYSYSTGLGASYAMRTGFLDVTPQILLDYYGLNEAKHTETGGSDFFNLTVAERNSNMLSSQALVNFSYNQWFVKPELWFGWKQNLSAEVADTVANFKGGTPFTLTAGDVAGGGPVAGFRFSADNQWSFFSLEGSYQKLDAYEDYSVSLRTRFQF